MTPLSQKAVEDARRQLASCALFRGLVTGERDALVGRARMRQFGAGEPIFLMGSAGTSMMAVLLEHHPNAWIRLVEVLCDRLRATDRQMAEVAMQHLPARLARALLRMTYVETLSRPTDRVQVSQRELGNIVGATRESVNNCLGQWQRAGWVRIDRTSIAIWDRASKKVPRAPKPKGSRRLRIKLSAEERKMLAAITVALNGKER
jgi:CRP/FNR family transcriptional regulator, cyclic AMP receptor protein